MDSKNDLRNLQQLSDAIAITLDAIRRIAPAASNGAVRSDMGWNPSPGVAAAAAGMGVGARLSHSAWPGWGADGAPPPMSMPEVGGWPRGFAHSGWAAPMSGGCPSPWTHLAWPDAVAWGARRMF